MPKYDGPDISHYQRITNVPADPQWTLFSHKTSEGRTYQDPTWPDHVAWARRQVVPTFKYIGGYHWVRSDSPMLAQADNVSRAWDKVGGMRTGEFFQIDWETTPGIPALTLGQIQEFQDILEGRYPGRGIMYGSDWVPNFTAWRKNNPFYPLWYANYNTSTKPTGGPAECAKFNADAWQWTSGARHPSIVSLSGGGIDMNEILVPKTFDRITNQDVPPIPDPVPLPPSQEVEMQFVPETRVFDTRTGAPGAMWAVPTGTNATGVVLNVTAIPQGTGGYLTVNGHTSFLNFGPNQAVTIRGPFQCNSDGTVSIGSTVPVHLAVDLVAVYN